MRYVGQPVAAVVARDARAGRGRRRARRGRLRAAAGGLGPARVDRDAGALGEARGRRRRRVRRRGARRPHRPRDPAAGRGADGAARRDRGAGRAADGVVLVAERAPRPRAARADPRPRRVVDPRARARRRRRVRLQGHAAGRDPGGRARRRAAGPAGQVGRGPATRTSSRRRRGAGSAGRSSSRSTPTGASSPCAGGSSPTSARTCCRARAIPPHTTAMLLSGCYDIPAVEVFVTGVRTNRVPTGPYRGAGRPEATYLIETTLDAAARELGVDAIELRRRNLVRSFPHRTALGWTYDSGDFERCLDTALARLGTRPRRRSRFARTSRFARSWASAPVGVGGGSGASWAAPPPEPASDVVRGTGVALCVERSGGLFEHASVTRDGEDFVVAVGSTPSGQGHTRCSRRSPPTGSGSIPTRVRVRHGGHRRARGRASARSPAARRRWAARRSRRPPTTCWPAARARPASSPSRSSPPAPTPRSSRSRARPARCACVKLVAVDDAGRIVNPLLAEGQVVGGAVQGLGAVLSEAGRPDDAARLRPARPRPTLPKEIATAFVESPSPLNPLGVKGIGEGGAIGTPRGDRQRARGRARRPPHRPAVHRREGLAGAAMTMGAAPRAGAAARRERARSCSRRPTTTRAPRPSASTARAR